MKPQAADFRADINGLRAVAVIAVVLYHFGVAGFAGGFVGVDVFFVISGYLMTRIILDPLAEGRFSVLRFYLARARRIFPALAALGALMLAYGWIALSPLDYRSLTKHVGASLLFLSNHVYWKESGYFDADAHEKWLLHTWSLSVEWQFYLLYPLLILAARRLAGKRSGMAAALWFLFLASLAWSAWLAYASPAKAFFLLPTRAWEMLAGGLLHLHRDACNRITQGRRWPEAAGLAAIVAAAVLYGPGMPWPGLPALLPVAGAMLVIADSAGRTRLLGGAALQGVGRWSYSVYLWHWPVAVWLHQSQSPRDGVRVAAGIALSLLLGWLSFRCVENPARRLVSRLKLLPALAACAAMALAPFATAAAFHYQNDRLTPLRFRHHPALEDAMAVETRAARYRGALDRHYREGRCLLPPAFAADDFSAECAGRNARFAIWGDSHAAHLWPGTNALAQSGAAAQWTANGCPPLLSVDLPKRANCRQINEWILRALQASRPDVVILAGAWLQHDEETIRRGLEATLSRLRADPSWQARIVVVGSVPAWRQSLPGLLANDLLSGDGRARSTSHLDPAAFRRDGFVRRVVGTRADFFSPIAAACDEAGCLRFLSGEKGKVPFAFDYGHLMEESSVFVMAALLRQIGDGAPSPGEAR